MTNKHQVHVLYSLVFFQKIDLVILLQNFQDFMSFCRARERYLPLIDL